MKKIICAVIGILLAVFVAFTASDCIRLMNARSETKPFITLSESECSNGNKYNGLGYSVRYYKDGADIYGAEFRMFDKILVWAWIE